MPCWNDARRQAATHSTINGALWSLQMERSMKRRTSRCAIMELNEIVSRKWEMRTIFRLSTWIMINVHYAKSRKKKLLLIISASLLFFGMVQNKKKYSRFRLCAKRKADHKNDDDPVSQKRFLCCAIFFCASLFPPSSIHIVHRNFSQIISLPY